MKFKYEDLKDSILCGADWPEKDLHLVEEGEWTQDDKYQSRDIIFKHQDKFYIIYESRSGSPFTDWHYEDHSVDKDGLIECDEVFKTEVVTNVWSTVNTKSELTEVKERLSEAESLLYDAKSLLNNIHGYDTDTYRDICKYLHGEDEEEECEVCGRTESDCGCDYCDTCNQNIDNDECEC